MKESGENGYVLTGGDGERLVTLGRVTGAHGLQGWIRVHSETSPRENIATFRHLLLGRNGAWQRWRLNAGRRQGKTVVLKLRGCNDRGAAEALVGAEIAIERAQLPQLEEPGEYYWTDLEGLSVETGDGRSLGRLERLFETGANDVMVVQGERERLIPFVWGEVVKDVDLDARRIRVDWDPEF